jgi:pimeloyl-ACP methyl ester carboxylesterase
MTHQSDNQIKLRDGRRLGYAEFGDPLGKPVLFFHGYPGSRWDGAETGHAAERVGVRLIAPDRPGMGLSDYQPKRRLLDWPQDVMELTNALKLDHFAVIGYSGGGPYALACAFQLDTRLSAVGIVAGIGPLTEPGAVDGMVKNNIQLFQMARRTPWLLRLIFSLNRRMDSLKLMQAAVPQMPSVDQEVVLQPGVLARMAKDYSEAFRQGARGTVHEGALYAREWGFKLCEVTRRVQLWQGEQDTNAPAAMGRFQAQHLPNCQATFYPADGHISIIVNHAAEILMALSLS